MAHCLEAKNNLLYAVPIDCDSQGEWTREKIWSSPPTELVTPPKLPHTPHPITVVESFCVCAENEKQTRLDLVWVKLR